MQESGDDRYCLVGTGFYCDFLLLPHRAPFYRADIAARFDISVNTVRLCPSQPIIRDAQLHGRSCRAVATVTSSPHLRPAQDDAAAILDCRPILEGWRRVETAGGCLDLEALRHIFERTAPEGFQVCFSGCRQHWTWLWIDPGQVLRVTYRVVEAPLDAGNREGATSEATDGNAPQEGHHSQASTQDADASRDHRGNATAEAPADASRDIPRAGGSVHFSAHPALGGDTGRSHKCRRSRRAYAKNLGRQVAQVHLLSHEPFARLDCAIHVPPVRHMCCAYTTHAAPSRWSNMPYTSVSLIRDVTTNKTSQVDHAAHIRQHKLLSEPVGSHEQPNGPVARARGYARAAGLPWPYDRPPLEDVQPADDVRVDAAATTGRAPLAVYLLLPSYSPEQFEVRVPLPTTPEEVVSALRQERSGFIRMAFPHVMLPEVQVSDRWLLACALPSWAVHEIHVIFDLTDIDGRLYLCPLPAVVNRSLLCHVAGIPGDEIEIFVEGQENPVPQGQDVHVSTSMLITFRPASEEPRHIFRLAQILQQGGERQPSPVTLPSPSGRHLCIVTDHGHQRLSFSPETSIPSPMTIPCMLGFPEGSRICVPCEPIREVELDGFHCSAVLAVASSLEPAEVPYVCILDCRGLLQGLTTFSFGEEGLPVHFVYDVLETFMPPHWRLHTEGADIVAGHYACRDGHTIRAAFVPEEPSPEGVATHDEGSESEPETQDPDCDDAFSHSSEDSTLRTRGSLSSSRSRSPRRDPGEAVDNPQGFVKGNRDMPSNTSRVRRLGGLFMGVLLCQPQQSCAAPFAPEPAMASAHELGCTRPRDENQQWHPRPTSAHGGQFLHRAVRRVDAHVRPSSAPRKTLRPGGPSRLSAG